MRFAIIKVWWPWLLAIYVQSAVYAQAPLPTEQWPAGVAPRAQLPQSRALDYEFKDVEVDNIEAWLEWVNIELPVEAAGKLSGWLWAQPSAGGWFSFGNYRLEGEISSEEFQLDDYVVRHMALRFGYADGHWYVGSLRGEVRPEGDNEVLGDVQVVAKIPTRGDLPLQTSGVIDRARLSPLLRSLGVDVDLSNSTGQLSFAGSVPLANSNDLRAWTASAALELQQVEFQQLPPGDLSARARLARGSWTVHDGTVHWLAEPLSIQGAGQLDQEYPYEFVLSGHDLSLEHSLQIFGMAELANTLSGSVDVRANLVGDATRGIAEVDFVTRATRLFFREQLLSDVEIGGQYRPESIVLNLRNATHASGSFQGQILWDNISQLEQGIPNSLQLSVDSLQLEQLDPQLLLVNLEGMLAGKVPNSWLLVPLTGVASGVLNLSSQQIEEHTAWASSGEIRIEDFYASHTSAGNVRLQWTKDVEQGEFEVQLQTTNQAISAQAVVLLNDADSSGLRHTRPTSYRATGRLQDFSTVWQPPIAGRPSLPLQISGAFHVEGTPEQWLNQGTASLDRVRTNWSGQAIEMRTAVLHILPDNFRLERFQIFDPRGRIAGAAIYRRDSQQAHQLNLRLVNGNLAAYASLFPDKNLRDVAGTVGVEMRLRKSAEDDVWHTGWKGEVAANLHELHYRGDPIGNLNLRGDISDDQLDAHLDGTVLGGQAGLDVKFPFESIFASPRQEFPSDKGKSWNFDARLMGVDLPRVMALFADPRRARLLSGTASLQVSGQQLGNPTNQLEALLRVPRLFYNRQSLAENLLLDINYSSNRWQIRELSGGIAGGRIDARGAVSVNAKSNLGESSTSTTDGMLQFSAQRVQLHSLVDFLMPEYADEFAGLLSYRGEARFQRQLQLSGVLQADRAMAFGLPVQRGHGNLRLDINPDGSLRQLVANNFTGTAVGGRFVGDISLRGGGRYDLSAQGQITAGKLEQLSRALGFERILGTGRFNGGINLQSRDASSLAALNGQLQIDFDQGDAQSVPVLAALARYVPALQLASTDITDGRLRARIGSGQLRMQDILLSGDTFWLAGSGNASLASGRLDMEAVLQTGGGIEQQVSQQLLQRIAVGILPQAALVAELNDLIRNRTLYFHIGGTTDHPIVQARAARTIGQAFLQNFSRGLLATRALSNADTD